MGKRKRIQRAHDLVITETRVAVGHAVRCGELLIRAKAAIGQDNWEQWLADNFAGSTRDARHYMELAARCEELSNLTVEEVVRRMNGGKRER